MNSHLALVSRIIDGILQTGVLPIPAGIVALMLYVRRRSDGVNIAWTYITLCVVWTVVWVVPDKTLERQGLRGLYAAIGLAIPLCGLAIAAAIIRFRRRDRLGFPVTLARPASSEDIAGVAPEKGSDDKTQNPGSVVESL